MIGINPENYSKRKGRSIVMNTTEDYEGIIE